MLSKRQFLMGGGAVIAAGAGAYLLIREDVGSATYFATDGIALRGADPVAYFTQGQAVIGTAEFKHNWRGVTWHFASASHRDVFAAAPDAYAPQYGGYCAWAVAAKEQLYSTQPENWTMRDGKLYLNYSDGIQAKWEEDPDGFITTGDKVWPRINATLG